MDFCSTSLLSNCLRGGVGGGGGRRGGGERGGRGSNPQRRTFVTLSPSSSSGRRFTRSPTLVIKDSTHPLSNSCNQRLESLFDVKRIRMTSALPRMSCR